MASDDIVEDSDVVEAYRFRDKSDSSRFVDIQLAADGTVRMGFPCYHPDSHSVVDGDCEAFYEFSPTAAMAIARTLLLMSSRKEVVN